MSTIRLKLHLTAPLRAEVASLKAFSAIYFAAVDTLTDALSSKLQPLQPSISRASTFLTSTSGGMNRYLLIPAVPAAVAIAASFPLVAGIFVVGFPIFLPLLTFFLLFLFLGSLLGTTLLLSTRHGRRKFTHSVNPLVTAFMASPLGQQFVFETGPRPSPVQLADHLLPTSIWHKLGVSLAIDFVGSCSYLIPAAGEVFDLAWAPAQTVLVMAMYDKEMPYLKYVSFAEEILPFTDIIPTASLGWCREFLPTLVKGGGRGWVSPELFD